MKSRIIDRASRGLDKEYELGFGIQWLVNDETCDSQRVVLGYTIMPPSSRNQAHVHRNCEVVWHLLSGHQLHIWQGPDGEYREAEGFPGRFGYASPGDIHPGINLSDTERCEVLFCYAGVNNKDRAGTEWVEPPEVVLEHLARRGLTLDDLEM